MKINFSNTTRSRANWSEMPRKQISINKENLGFGQNPSQLKITTFKGTKANTKSPSGSPKEVKGSPPKLQLDLPSQDVLDMILQKNDLVNSRVQYGMSTSNPSETTDEKIYFNNTQGSDIQDIMKVINQKQITDY